VNSLEKKTKGKMIKTGTPAGTKNQKKRVGRRGGGKGGRTRIGRLWEKEVGAELHESLGKANRGNGATSEQEEGGRRLDPKIGNYQKKKKRNTGPRDVNSPQRSGRGRGARQGREI